MSEIPPPNPPGVGSTGPADHPHGGPPTEEERYWAMGAHGGALVGLWLGGFPAFIAPLVIYLVKKDESAFVADHAWKALRAFIVFFATMFIAGILLFCLMALVIGVVFIPVIIATALGYLAYAVYGLVMAGKGELVNF